mmetsp:Transcript_57240/g.136082  ORF Transcript_57240/g.136082 Transcript_57240/m.136082 type:complete len:216 (-) Transcript_57240:342-989(-)
MLLPCSSSTGTKHLWAIQLQKPFSPVNDFADGAEHICAMMLMTVGIRMRQLIPSTSMLAATLGRQLSCCRSWTSSWRWQPRQEAMLTWVTCEPKRQPVMLLEARRTSTSSSSTSGSIRRLSCSTITRTYLVTSLRWSIALAMMGGNLDAPSSHAALSVTASHDFGRFSTRGTLWRAARSPGWEERLSRGMAMAQGSGFGYLLSTPWLGLAHTWPI